MDIRPLSSCTFKEIISCFLQAFENYFVPMSQDETYYKKRWEAACIDYNYSFGAFDKELLVGFILIGIDTRNNLKVSYNMGTGVLPNYRGQNIVGRLYAHAIPQFKNLGVQLCQLEVIQKNTAALKSYQRIGFTIQKNYLCFTFNRNGVLQPEEFQINPIEIHQIIPIIHPYNRNYSWDNQVESLLKANFSSFLVSFNSTLVGYIIINLETGYIAQCEVFIDEEVYWDILIQAVFELASDGRIHNVEKKLISKIQTFKKFNFKQIINQFEMKMVIG
jgi:ribosomal protein S18 acetylase RimI-like enzyme